jgi:hypothetical protein
VLTLIEPTAVSNCCCPAPRACQLAAGRVRLDGVEAGGGTPDLAAGAAGGYFEHGHEPRGIAPVTGDDDAEGPHDDRRPLPVGRHRNRDEAHRFRRPRTAAAADLGELAVRPAGLDDGVPGCPGRRPQRPLGHVVRRRGQQHLAHIPAVRAAPGTCVRSLSEAFQAAIAR